MKSVIALVLTLGFALSLYAGDASVYLDSTNGGSSVVVYDAQTSELMRVQSDGAISVTKDVSVNGKVSAGSFEGNGALITNLPASTLQQAYNTTPWYGNDQSTDPVESNLVTRYGTGRFIDASGAQVKVVRGMKNGNNGTALSAVVDDPKVGYGAMSARVQGNTNALTTTGNEVCAFEGKLADGGSEWVGLMGVKANAGIGIMEAGAAGATPNMTAFGALGATLGGSDYAGLFLGAVGIQGSLTVNGSSVLTSYSETDPVWAAEKAAYATGTPLYVFTESDPLWAAEKSAYATGTPLYVFTESDPLWEAEKSAYATGTPLYTFTESDPVWAAEKGDYLQSENATLQQAYNTTPWYGNDQSTDPVESNLVTRYGTGRFIDASGAQVKVVRGMKNGNNGTALSAVVDDPKVGYGAMSARVQGNTNALTEAGNEVCAFEGKLADGDDEWTALLGVKLNTGMGILQAGALGLTADHGELGALGVTFGGNDYAGLFLGAVGIQGSLTVNGSSVLTSYSETDPVWAAASNLYAQKTEEISLVAPYEFGSATNGNWLNNTVAADYDWNNFNIGLNAFDHATNGVISLKVRIFAFCDSATSLHVGVRNQTDSTWPVAHAQTAALNNISPTWWESEWTTVTNGTGIKELRLSTYTDDSAKYYFIQKATLLIKYQKSLAD